MPNKYYKKNYSKHREHIVKHHIMYNKTIDGKYIRYKYSAKQRGLEFNLTKDQFNSIVSKNCSYCGGEGFGLDRMNNDIGYLLENVTSCCTPCNMMKKILPTEIFIEHCRKIVKFNELKQHDYN
jgi:hypothetical protein